MDVQHQTGFAELLFTHEEESIEKFQKKETKIAFLTKIVACIKFSLGDQTIVDMLVSPSKVHTHPYMLLY